MYHRMAEDMDINCGEIMDGGSTLEEMGAFSAPNSRDSVSKRSKSEIMGYGEDEFAPWQLSATL